MAVRILETISRKLQLDRFWNISPRACVDDGAFIKRSAHVPPGGANNVTWDVVTMNGTRVCHVKTM